MNVMHENHNVKRNFTLWSKESIGPWTLDLHLRPQCFGFMVVILLYTLAACFPPPFSLLCLIKSWERNIALVNRNLKNLPNH
jgi:hypothetical protein